MTMEHINVNPEAYRRAVYALREGGVIAYPTEGVYGLGCDPLNATAVTRLLALKHRSAGQGLILIAATLAQLEPYIEPLTKEQIEKIEQTEEVITWIVPARPGLSTLIRGDHATVAVRVTRNSQAKELCLQFGGALISTSANLKDQPPAMDNIEVYKIFDDKIDYILPGRVGGLNKPSMIKDLLTDKILRA